MKWAAVGCVWLALTGCATGQVPEKADELAVKLRKQLKDPDETVRLNAATSLSNMGPAAFHALTELIEALKDSSAAVRARAAMAIGQIGPKAPAAAAALARALKDREPTVRQRAAGALGSIGPEAKAAVPALIEALDDDDVHVPVIAIGTLGRIGPNAGPAIPILIKRLDGASATRQGEIVRSLTLIGQKDKQVRALFLQWLNSSDPKKCACAAIPFSKIADKGEAMPHLLAAYRSKAFTEQEHKSLRKAICMAWQEMGPDAKEAVSLLIEGIKDTWDPNGIGGACVGTLRRIGPAAKDAIPALVAIMKDPAEIELFERLAYVMAGIGPDALPDLDQFLSDPRPGVRERTVRAIESMGPAAKPAIPALRKALEDSESAVRARAKLALRKIGE